MTNRRNDRGTRRGVAAAELALMLPFLTFLLLGVVDFGRLFYSYTILATCARNGAIVYPVMLMLTIGLAIVGLGVFRYLQVAELAREGARYAAVHGGEWATDWNSGTLTTRDNVYNNAILPHAAGLDSTQLANTD